MLKVTPAGWCRTYSCQEVSGSCASPFSVGIQAFVAQVLDCRHILAPRSVLSQGVSHNDRPGCRSFDMGYLVLLGKSMQNTGQNPELNNSPEGYCFAYC